MDKQNQTVEQGIYCGLGQSRIMPYRFICHRNICFTVKHGKIRAQNNIVD
ncbi:hypothetical protein NEISICOT_00787 [Neisseria sicca ATCC 29256]|uniref:Uncharacterized protein n=1 Tax=Neisseria sicca ATCC 29256 TaxID=547045 RepID=C6M2P8_NEISI|nr:hypothetical protein NEISICOT_00787 [Neisseria sicca ATCC 29256]